MGFPRRAAIKRGTPVNHAEVSKVFAVLLAAGFGIVGLMEMSFGALSRLNAASKKRDERRLRPEELEMKRRRAWDPLFASRDTKSQLEFNRRYLHHQMDNSFRKTFVEAAEKGESVDFDKMKEGITGKFVFTRSREKREAAKKE